MAGLIIELRIIADRVHPAPKHWNGAPGSFQTRFRSELDSSLPILRVGV